MRTHPAPASRIALALTAALLLATGPEAAGQDRPPQVVEMPLPGGVAALLRAADLPGQPDPATAMLAFVRGVHVFSPDPSGAIAYLDAVTLLHSAAKALPDGEARLPSGGTVPPAVRAWIAACGLGLQGATVIEPASPETVARRRALARAGFPIAGWMARLNDGGAVRLDISTETVPLPLAAETWAAVLGRRVSADDLAGCIFRDRRASLVYYGLMALDDETLSLLADHPSLLAGIAATGAGAFAEWGRSIHVRDGRVDVPGGGEADPLWARLVGRDPGEAAAFIGALFGKDFGRAAFFYDTLAHLDPARQRFALGLSEPDGRAERFLALYGVFARTTTFDQSGAWPIIRHPFNPSAILREVRVDEAGRMAAPAARGLWDAAMAGGTACAKAGSDGRPADAAWLVGRIEREFLDSRGGWLGAVAFAQRVFGRSAPGDAAVVCEVAAAFPRANGLLLTLERIGLDGPAEYAAALALAGRLWSGGDREAAIARVAQVQVVLAVIERAVSSRSLAPAAARQLVASLASLERDSRPGWPAAGEGAPRAGVARWMKDTLLRPDVCGGQWSADRCLVALVSGAGRSAGAVSWEDDRYRIDLGAATAERITRILQAQRATPIEEAMDLLAAATILADPRASAADLDRASAILKVLQASRALGVSELFGRAVPPMRPPVEAAVFRASIGAGQDARAAAAEALLPVVDALLAHGLVSFAYAMAIGDPDDSALMAGDPARRHLFDGTLGPAPGPWHLPEEVRAVDRSWVVEGSVLMLRTVYARSWQRRISIQDPGERPGPDPQDVRAFGETASTFNPFALTDDSRDAIVSAIARGRARVAALVRSPDALWAAAAEAGLGEWRCRAALWEGGRPAGAASPPDPEASTFFSLVELMRLGRPELPPSQIDAWGVATRPVDGGPWTAMPHARTWEDVAGPLGVGLLASQMADVHLRVAEVLASMKLPAALAPDVAAYAGWDAMTAAAMSDPDDWYAMSRAAASLPADRFLDYVSALTAIGPLVPARDQPGAEAPPAR